jgi:hypothetical protein
MPLSQEKLSGTTEFASYLEKVSDVEKIKTGIDKIIEFRSFIPADFKDFTEPTFKKALEKLAKAKPGVVADYIGTVFK